MRPIILLVEREDDGWYVVSDDIFGVYGDAESLWQAVDQYASGLIDEYEFFCANRGTILWRYRRWSTCGSISNPLLNSGSADA